MAYSKKTFFCPVCNQEINFKHPEDRKYFHTYFDEYSTPDNLSIMATTIPVVCPTCGFVMQFKDNAFVK